MRRLLAIFVLTIGLIPSIPVFVTSAALPSDEELNSLCRERLGHGPTDPLVGSEVFQLRRCINNMKTQFERAELLERRLQRYDQRFWQRYEYGQEVLRESRRSLDSRMQQQRETRTNYYKDTSVQERAVELQAHRRSRRAVVREKEQQLLRERRIKQEKWQNAIRACRTYERSQQQQCFQFMLT